MPNSELQQPLTIVGRASSINVRKVLWTCQEVGLAYTFDSDWNGELRVTRADELLALNPNGQFPVLIDKVGPLWESNTICRYIAAQCGRNDLLPVLPRERAKVEQWMDWQATDLNSAWRYAFMALVRRSAQFDRQRDVDASVAAWNTAMGILEKQLAATSSFVTGNVFTLADIAIGVSVNRWLLTPMLRPNLPAVLAYYERLGDRPGFVTHVRNSIP